MEPKCYTPVLYMVNHFYLYHGTSRLYHRFLRASCSFKYSITLTPHPQTSENHMEGVYLVSCNLSPMHMPPISACVIIELCIHVSSTATFTFSADAIYRIATTVQVHVHVSQEEDNSSNSYAVHRNGGE